VINYNLSWNKSKNTILTYKTETIIGRPPPALFLTKKGKTEKISCGTIKRRAFLKSKNKPASKDIVPSTKEKN